MNNEMISVLRTDDCRILFESIDEGINIIEKVNTRENERIDFRYVLTNPAFEKITGLTGVIGKTVIEVLPGVNDSTMQVYDNIVITGQPVRFETYEKSLDQWFSAYAFPIGEPQLKRVAVIFNDISTVKKSEIALRESEDRKGYMLKLSDALRSIADPVQIQLTACSVLGEHIGASRVLYGDVVNEREVVISRDYVKGVPSLAARLSAVHFSQFTIDSYKSGKPVIINDVSADTRLSEDERAAFASIHVAANISLGLIKNGKWVAAFGAHHAEPRNWTPLEISLMEETAERTWAAVERARTEEALRESEKKYRTIIESSGEGIVITKPYGDFFYMNQRFIDMLGYSQEELRGKSSTDLSYPQEHPQIMQISKGELLQGEFKFRKKDGSVLWTMYNATPVFNDAGEHISSFVMHTDITERKQAEEKLVFQTGVLANVHDAIGVLDKNYTFIYWNDMAERMFGWTAQEAIGRSSKQMFRTIIPGSTRADAVATMLKNDYYTGEAIFYHKDGRDIYISLHGSVIRDQDGEVKEIIASCRDITERKHTEEALRKSEEKYRTLFNSIDEGFAIIELIRDDQGQLADFIYLEANKSFEQNSGLNNVVGKKVRDLFPKLEQSWLDFIQRVSDTGEPVHAENYSVDLDRWFDFRYSCLGQAGSPFIAAVFTDITERKKAEEALRESEEKYRAIVENAGEGIIISRTDGSTTFVNQQMADMLGYDIDEMLGRPAVDFTFVDLEHRVYEATVEVHESGTLEGDFKLRRKDGSPLWTHFTGVRLYDDQGRHVANMALHTDITKRKQAEEAIAADRKRFFDVLETLPVMICLITPDYHIPFSNKAFREKFGEANGRYCYDFCCGFSEPCTFCESLMPLKTGQAHNWEFTSPVGSTIIDAYDFPISDIDGSPLILEMDVDITERKRAEEALRESENRAHELVRVLEEADKNKNKFISVLSHELRNPLATITVGLSVLGASADIQQTESVKEIIKRQVNQLCKLVDDLLDLTRITQNKIKLKKEIILLNEIVRNAVEDIKPEYDKKGVQIWGKILTQPIFLCADPIRITQCVGNLLYNAVKFTPANGNVWVSLKQENNEAVLSVQDNGIGISQGILAKLFQPFTQADDSLDRYDNNGLGLGLSIIKGIVELHDGKVLATSEGLGKGALFTIRLPIASDNTQIQGNAAIQKARQVFRILIIEDNKDLADLLHSMFSVMGHEAYAVYNGMDGIAKAREIQPDIIFCDIGLPGKNGFEVAKIIREDTKLKNVFLIALTGYAGEHDVEHAKKSGFDRHLAKPIDMDTLKRVLSEDI